MFVVSVQSQVLSLVCLHGWHSDRADRSNHSVHSDHSDYSDHSVHSDQSGLIVGISTEGYVGARLVQQLLDSFNSTIHLHLL